MKPQGGHVDIQSADKFYAVLCDFRLFQKYFLDSVAEMLMDLPETDTCGDTHDLDLICLTPRVTSDNPTAR